MKTDRPGQSGFAARNPLGTDETAQRMKPPFRRALIAAAVVIVIVLVTLLARHPIAGIVLTRVLSAAFGDRVAFHDFVLGRTQSVFRGLHVVTASGDPLLDADELRVRYSLHDLVWGGRHRYGVTFVSVERPRLTIVRHADATYNLQTLHVAGGSRGAAPGGVPSPFTFGLRIRDGEIHLIDRAPIAEDLREQVVRGLTLDMDVASDRQSRARGRAVLVGRQTANSPLASWPIALTVLSDTPRGLAIVGARAAALPLRGGVGFVQHSSAVRVDDGLLHSLDLKFYALNVGLDQPPDIHIGAAAELTDGRLTCIGLRLPVRRLRGRLTLTDDGLWTTGLSGTLAGIPVDARGGAFNRAAPVVRLGIAANGDLAELRTVFAFSRTQPVGGVVSVQTVIEAPVSRILIRSAVHVPRGRYGAIPLSEIGGRVDYYASSVVLDAVHARYGPNAVELGGRFLLGRPALDSRIAIAARGPGSGLPFAENLAADGSVDALALVTGGTGYRVRGAIGVAGPHVAGRAMFAVDPRGVGEFGPFAFERDDGSSLVGALRLERPTSQSAGWISARHYRVRVPKTAARLAGLSVPAFPPIAGLIDASLAGGGSPDRFGLVGSLSGQDLQVADAHLGSGQAQLGGTLRDVRLSEVSLNGPLGRFRGNAAAANGAFALSGQYHGSLESLVPLTGRQLAFGALDGGVLATLEGRNVVVQSAGARLRHGSVRGVALDTAAGTLAVRSNVFHLIVADGSIGGRHAVARESRGRVAVSAPNLPSAALRGTGLPLEAGELSVYGSADLRGKAANFDGTVAVAAGRAHGYAVTGDAQLDLDGPHATIFAATGALGTTYGAIGGSIDGIGERALRYDLDTRVPLGDLNVLGHDLRLPVRYLTGSFAANLHVRGAGARPFVVGTIAAPEGSYNGLAFRAASARLNLDDAGVAARDGTITVGSTRAYVAAGAGSGTYALTARAASANLADFNDYFNAADTLAGHGTFDFAFRTSSGVTGTTGNAEFSGLRYREFALGDFAANWHMKAGAIVGQARIGGASGTLAATASIAPAGGGDPIRAFRAADYRAHATFERVDLATWLPAAGFTQPVLGNVDAQVTVAGQFPRLALGVDASLNAGSVAGFPVRGGRLRATSLGTRIAIANAAADLGFAKLSAGGSLGLGAGDPLAFDLRATTGDVGQAIRAFVPAARGRSIGGALDADVRLGGSLAKPTVEGGFALTNGHYGTLAIPRAIGELALAGRAVELRDADVEFTHGQAFVAGSLPLQLQPFRLGPPRAPVSFDVTVRSVDLTQFEALLPGGSKLGGTVDGRFGVEGSVDRPRMLGSLAIVNGSYLSTFERAPIQHFDARLAFAGSNIALQTFHAGVGNGTLDAGGSLTLPFGANPHTSYALDVRAKAAQLDFPAYGRGTLDGAVRLTAGPASPLVAGDIALRNALIPVAAVYGSGSGSGGAGGTGFPIDPAFALHVTAGDNVRIHSSIVDVGVTGGVDVSGSLRVPRLAGAFTATDGSVSTYNHVFRIVNASATFSPADGILPTIDARATARVTNPDPDPSRNIAGSANITVTVTGTPDSNNLQVAYSSDPPYSQEQIVGLLFDVPALLGAVNFNLNGGPSATLLRGAPGETNALLPPGVTPEQVSAISFNQEVFSLLSGQLTQHALTPVERVFEKVFGLSDLEFTVDYGGGIGYSLRRQIGKRNFYAFLSQTVTYPERSNFGFELEPKPFETLNFSFYQQNGITSLITNQTPGGAFSSGSTRRLISVQPLGNRSGFSLNFNRRY